MSISISIIGAGIAGLTLGRSLLRRGIPAILYEKAAPKSRFNYGITLHATAYKPLLKLLEIDEDAFRKRVAVDTESDGCGKLGTSLELLSHDGLYDTQASFRANRNKLEQLLREGLDIRWEHTLESIEHPSQDGTRLQFSNGEASAANIIVAADGVHSSIRKLLLPSAQLNILPYIAFNGKNRISRETFDASFAPAMRGANVIEAKHDDVVLNISVSEKKDEEISMSWIYSRAVRSDLDPLHQLNRSKEDAKKIPEELFKEVEILKSLEPAFSEIFDVKKMRNDRILHWLMRTLLPPLPQLQRLSEDTGVCFIGEAVHAEPIIGGNGANAAILDALSLAEEIANNDRMSISNWYHDMYPVWTKGVEQSQKNIANMHQPLKPVSGNL
jgi:tyrosinase